MPKTIRNKYHEYLSFENLLSAHKKARRGKREKRQIIGVELALEQILFDLEKDLRERKYIHGEYNTFTIYDPKEREIKASHYKDRIVHQWYVENFIIPYFVPQFIETSYACITGRGMHKASSDVQDAMRKCSKKWNSSYYILKMDVSKYFQNIDKKALFEILKRKIIAISTYTKSLKEAQTYLSYMTFPAMIPSLATMFMGAGDMQTYMSCIPIFNTICAVKMILSGVIDYGFLTIGVIANIIFVILITIFVIRMFNNEKIVIK